MYGLKYDQEFWENIIGFQFDVYRVARQYGASVLQELAFNKVKKIAKNGPWCADQVIEILERKRYYSTTEDEESFRFLIDTCHDHIAELVDDFEFEMVLESDSAIGKH